MIDPRKQRYFYGMMAGFGAISLSILLFFLLYRLQGVGKLLGELSAILAPFIYGGVMAYLLRPLCNALEAFFQMHFTKKLKRFANAAAYLVTTKKGAIRSMPEKRQVLEILNACPADRL